MGPLHLFFIALAFVVGACVGSFANVMGLRLLKEEDFIKTPSHCPQCSVDLAWYDNIPIVSWLLLRAKCRQCQTSISFQYPLIELLTGGLFAAVIWRFGANPNFILADLLLFFLLFNLVVIIITDLKESLIYQINSLSLVPAGFIFVLLGFGSSLLGLPINWIDSILGILAAIAVFEGLILLSKLAFGTEGFGHGDTHLMMGVGAFLGWQLCLIAILMGFVVQTIPAVPMLVIQWVRNKQWVSLISGGLGAFFGLLPLGILHGPLGYAMNSQVSLWVTLICLVLSLISLFIFLRNVKRSESFTYLPLGPALVVASIICLFWGPQILGQFVH